MIRKLVAILGLVALTALLCLTYGFFIEPRFLKIRHDHVQTDAPRLDTLKIALVSDIHIAGRHVSAQRVSHIVKTVNAQAPDIVLIAGDFVNGHTARADHDDAFNAVVKDGLSRLAALKAPLGTFAVIGNHDVWYDKPFVRDALKDVDITVLENDSRRIKGDLCIVGLADHDTEVEDPRAFDECAPMDTQIALMHSPDSFVILPKMTAIAVAGHTHGGQINLPFLGRKVTSTSLGKPYAYGRADFDGIPVWVSAGIGTSIMSARFRAPPEIVILTVSGQLVERGSDTGQ